MFDEGYEFKHKFTTLLKDYYIQTVCMAVNTTQDNNMEERLNQVIYNMLVTKDLDKKLFDYRYPWG